MLNLDQFVIVGGTGRNVGKTEFVCHLIEKTSKTNEVYALKVSAVFPDEAQFHGDHSKDKDQQFLFEEKNSESQKDTARMLRAGAKRVFYIRAEDVGIEKAFHEFLDQLPEHVAVVCESNSLGGLVKPALQIMVTQPDKPIKERSRKQLDSADLLVISDGVSGFTELNKLHLNTKQRWVLV